MTSALYIPTLHNMVLIHLCFHFCGGLAPPLLSCRTALFNLSNIGLSSLSTQCSRASPNHFSFDPTLVPLHAQQLHCIRLPRPHPVRASSQTHCPSSISHCCSRGICYSAQLLPPQLFCSPLSITPLPTCILPFFPGSALPLALSPSPPLVPSSCLLFRLVADCPRSSCCLLVAVHPLATRPLEVTSSLLPSPTYSTLRQPFIFSAVPPVVFPHLRRPSSCILNSHARSEPLP